MTHPHFRPIRLFMLSNAVLAAAILAGCGGGGDAASESAATLSQQAIASSEPVSSPELLFVADNNESLAPSLAEEMASSSMSTIASVGRSLSSTISGKDPAPDVSALSIKVESASVRSTDIAAQARASQNFSSQQWGNVQCNGAITQSQRTSELGVHGSKLVGGKTLRFGPVSGSEVGSGQAYEFTLHPADPITAGSHRCEIAFASDAARGIPQGATFWHGFSVKIPDWRSTTDEQALAQWHAGDASGLLPIYTLLVRGKVMRLVLRYDTAATPSRATTKTIVIWSTSNWTPNTWLNFVTQAKVSPSISDNPFIKTWMNGTQIVDYSGPVGFYQPSVRPYAKHGIYHWVDSTNPWDMSLPTRTIQMKRPMLVRDSSGQYERSKIEALLSAD